MLLGNFMARQGLHFRGRGGGVWYPDPNTCSQLRIVNCSWYVGFCRTLYSPGLRRNWWLSVNIEILLGGFFLALLSSREELVKILHVIIPSPVLFDPG